MLRKITLFGVLIALAWNLYLVIGAALNIEAILPRVAGGGYDSLPVALRIVYFVQILLTIFQIGFVTILYARDGAWSRNSYLITRIFLVLAVVSTLVNAVSRSHPERWNAISAATIAVGFYFLGNVKIRPTR